MGKMIKVELRDGSLCRMAPKALDIFLTRDKVVRFKRSDGWAVVGRDLLRVMKKVNEYTGSERRIAV